MAGRECYHCKQWIQEGEAHNCWTTTEEALTRDLSVDLQEAWERLRETAVEFGDQRIYASLNSIMFSRKACYCFVRPKQKYLEVCVFLGRTVVGPQVQRAAPASKTKVAHLIRVRHREEVEAPITDWMREAYEQSDALSARPRAARRETPVDQGKALASAIESGAKKEARKTKRAGTTGKTRARKAAKARTTRARKSTSARAANAGRARTVAGTSKPVRRGRAVAAARGTSGKKR